MLVRAALLSAILAAGCGTTASKIASPLAAVGCAALDIATTETGWAIGAHEMNPLVGDDPDGGSRTRLYAVKAGSLAIAAIASYLADWSETPWIGAAAINCGAAAWNTVVIQREAAD